MRQHFNRKQVAYRQEYVCAGPCKRLLPPHFHLDHRVPLFLSDSLDRMDNLQALCGNCHAEKTGMENSFRGRLRSLYEQGMTLCPWCVCEVPVDGVQEHVCDERSVQKREITTAFGEFIQQWRYRRRA